MLRKIFGPKREEVTGVWRKLHNEELYDSYPLSDIRVIKLREIRWAGHVEGERREAYLVLWRNVNDRDHLEDLGIDGRIILKWIFRQ